MSSGRPPPPKLTPKQHRYVVEAMPRIEAMARGFCTKFGRLVAHDDLCTLGKLAAYDSAPRYKDGPNRSFWRFAKWRIYGAMMGEVQCESEEATLRRDMLRAFANFVADYDDDFDILNGRPEIQRRLDLYAASGALVMFLVARERERQERERDPVADAEEHVVTIDALREVHEALEPEQRELLRLLFVQNFDQHRVGELMGVAHETVCRRLGRVLTELRRALKDHNVRHAPPPMQLDGLPPVLGTPDPEEDEPTRGSASSKPGEDSAEGVEPVRDMGSEPEGGGPGTPRRTKR